jgi:hypothetical protein
MDRVHSPLRVSLATISPTHKPTTNPRGNSKKRGLKHEGAVRAAFQELLNAERQFGWKVAGSYTTH